MEGMKANPELTNLLVDTIGIVRYRRIRSRVSGVYAL